MSADAAIRVLVVEDHPLFRQAVVATLGAEPDIQVVADVGGGADAVVAAASMQPTVVVLDLGLPDIGGIEVAAQLRDVAPAAGVLIMTSADDDAAVYAALRTGARGYLLKSAGAEEIVEAVRSIARGNGVFAGSVVDRIARHVATVGRSTAAAAAAFPHLTPREREVLDLVAQGRSDTWIADHFVLSLKTVRNHVSNVLAKVGASSRAEAVAMARDKGLGQREVS